MKKKIIFNLLNFIKADMFLRLQKKHKLTVLSLHRISDEEDFFWNPITPASFEALLQYLQKHYSVILFRDLLNPKTIEGHSKPLLILSFDDGYYDFYEHALPLLIRYGLPANHNIVNECAENNMIIWTQRLNNIFNYCRNNDIKDLAFAGSAAQVNLSSCNNNWMQFYLIIYRQLLGFAKEPRLKMIEEKEIMYSLAPKVRMMNWQEIIDCSRHGIEIGCHTYSHDVLSTITNKEILFHEIVNAKIELEKRIHHKVNILALPNGEGHMDINRMAEMAGIKHILHVDDKLNELDKYQQIEECYDTFRVNLVQEPFPQMILRTEMFHAKMKNYV